MGNAPDAKLSISLLGPFRLRVEGGSEIPVVGVMSKRLLALLVRSEGMRRARTTLQYLLWDSSTADPANSLRQLILQTRNRLGRHAHCLHADPAMVCLLNTEDRTDSGRVGQGEFFEDAGSGSEEFEDWLRLERSAFENHCPAPSGYLLTPPCNSRPMVGLGNTASTFADSRQGVVTEWVTNLFRDTLAWNEFIEFRDLRDVAASVTCDAKVLVSVIPLDDVFEISVAGSSAGRCFWSASLQVPSGRSLQAHRDRILEFAQFAVAAVERRLPAIAASRQGADAAAPPLYDIVARLFTLRRADVLWAAERLEAHDGEENLAAVLAWQGFSKMLLNGELLVSNRETALSEAVALINCALDVDPSSPTALNVAAHHAAFVTRDFAAARELSDRALALAPLSPFGRDVRATLELYDDQLADASRHSSIALRLGQTGPLRHYLAATPIMLDTLTGRHAEAVRAGVKLLVARPRFLPVLRHLCVSLAEIGAQDRAREMIGQLRRIDPAFGTPAMADEDYPLPSERSRRIIASSLRKGGLDVAGNT